MNRFVACQSPPTQSLTATTVEGTPSPSTVFDSIQKVVVGASGVQGRGLTVTMSPTQTIDQWNVQQIAAQAVVTPAVAGEP